MHAQTHTNTLTDTHAHTLTNRQTHTHLFRRLEQWQKHGYSTAVVEVESDDEELEEGVESDESCDLGYISGDVTHPQSTGEGDAIIVHCVGE